uniref:Aminotransferase class V domain-containing protein n=1 Tax=Tetradesmus obliquus TaxID=3088 RepID=A0A383VTC1_TETOB|eukprot:jgi/Sobl393_1/10475/SZX68143.1
MSTCGTFGDNPASLPCGSLEEARAAFLQQHGAAYGYSGWLDANYQAELGKRLEGQHYLDWTGSGQYTTSQLRAIMAELEHSAFGNPHSRNTSSLRATQEVAAARRQVLAHFNADPQQYHCIFTRGATESMKMVSEFFPWSPGKASSSSSSSSSQFIYTQANHKSVLGMGAYAKQAGAELRCLSREQMQQWLDTPNTNSSSSSSGGCGDEATNNGNAAAAAESVTLHLVAYPVKDNYEGQLYPTDWVAQAHAKSDGANKYLVMLDAAAYVPTHSLDLSQVQADFVPVSFYKMFGYPSGLGALIVSKAAAVLLHKVYFGGGSVDWCTAEDAWHVLSPLPAGWEDGTLSFLSIASLKHGFAQLEALGGMEAIAAHVESLRSWMHRQLTGLRHSNGAPLVQLFGRHEQGHQHQSGIFQFQVLCPRGSPIPPGVVEGAAAAAGLQLRTGCNCNPGVCLPNLGITPEEERSRAASNHRGQLLTVLRPAKAAAAADGSRDSGMVPVQLPTGSIRVSLGYLSTFEDMHAVLRFLHGKFVDDRGVKLLAAADSTLEWSAEVYC